MELKEFIKTTMQSIIDATSELIEENRGYDTMINPGLNAGSASDSVRYTDAFVPVTEVSFDVAVTEGAAKSGGGGASINVLAAKIGGDGKISASNENVSRVQFSLRAALPATELPVEGAMLQDYMKPRRDAAAR